MIKTNVVAYKQTFICRENTFQTFYFMTVKKLQHVLITVTHEMCLFRLFFLRVCLHKYLIFSPQREFHIKKFPSFL